tara:strand:- start:3186 stop:3635 length:450 start_codon:yes stop_codon:yes gene_type:complete
MIDKRKLKTAHANWVLEQKFDLFGTAKFVDGENLHIDIAVKRIRYFFNMLDRSVRNAEEVKNNRRLDRMVFLERGRSRSNVHAHFYIKGKNAKETKDIIVKAQKIWQKVDNANDLVIKLNEDYVGTSRYCVKELDNIDTDILLLDCTHI